MATAPLQFQLVDWYGADRFDEEDDSEYKTAETYDVTLFGRTISGESVVVLVQEFHPFFFIRVPDSFSQKQIKLFCEFIKKKNRLLKTHLESVTLVHRYPFKGFTNNTKSKFLKLVFTTKQAMNRCRYLFQNFIKGDDDFEAGVPESFNVLVKEIRSLGLSVDLLDRDLD